MILVLHRHKHMEHEPMVDLGGSVFGMYAGDASQDGSINATDIEHILDTTKWNTI